MTWEANHAGPLALDAPWHSMALAEFEIRTSPCRPAKAGVEWESRAESWTSEGILTDRNLTN